MKIAIVVYDRINLVSLAEIWSLLSNLQTKHDVKICAFKSEIVDEHGLKIVPQIYSESLYGYDVVIIPDGLGVLSLRHDEIFLSWIRSAGRARLKIALDLGALIFGGAGFLEGRGACLRAGYKNAIGEYAKFINANMCEDGDIVTICELNSVTKDRLAEILI
ncbi:DJ-1/PfpI family protein [Campylobacter sp. RM16187]|uniref:DJ-1/PfpI family protein n=1 Tax=Campylobacter sp. RM16187 TaxID=1660063 RepID=UPI0021B667A5|nr:DJ-1/PfpI family protein [Campylobacter sp. RM16187]QKG29671.1 putative DUF4066 domain protein [Campylobacter sp. RM16187]